MNGWKLPRRSDQSPGQVTEVVQILYYRDPRPQCESFIHHPLMCSAKWAEASVPRALECLRQK